MRSHWHGLHEWTGLWNHLIIPSMALQLQCRSFKTFLKDELWYCCWVLLHLFFYLKALTTVLRDCLAVVTLDDKINRSHLCERWGGIHLTPFWKEKTNHHMRKQPSIRELVVVSSLFPNLLPFKWHIHISCTIPFPCWKWQTYS